MKNERQISRECFNEIIGETAERIGARDGEEERLDFLTSVYKYHNLPDIGEVEVDKDCPVYDKITEAREYVNDTISEFEAECEQLREELKYREMSFIDRSKTRALIYKYMAAIHIEKTLKKMVEYSIRDYLEK